MERRRLVGRQTPPPSYQIRGVIEEISNQIGKYKKVIEEQGKEFDTTFSLENVLRSNS